MSALAITLAALALSTPGANGDPGAIVDAIEHDRGSVTAAGFIARPSGSTTAIGEAASATTQPLDGATMAYLSDGDATAGWYGAQSDNLGHIRGTTVRGGHDTVIVSLRVSAPAEGDGDPSTRDAPANFALVRMPDRAQAGQRVGALRLVLDPAGVRDALRRHHPVAHLQGPGVTRRAPARPLDLRPRRHRVRLDGGRRQPAPDPPAAGGVHLSGARPVLHRRGPRRADRAIRASGDRLSGTASTGPNDTRSVAVEVEGRSWTTSVRGDGTWAMTPPGPATGVHEARALQVDAAEGRSARQAFTVEAAPDPEPTSTPTPGPTASPISDEPGGTDPTPAPRRRPARTREAHGRRRRLTFPRRRACGRQRRASAARPRLSLPCAEAARQDAETAARAIRRAHCGIGRIARRRAGGTRVKLTLRR